MNYWKLYDSKEHIIKKLKKLNQELKKCLDESFNINLKTNKLLQEKLQENDKLKKNLDILHKDNIILEQKNYNTIVHYEKKINDMDLIIKNIIKPKKKSRSLLSF